MAARGTDGRDSRAVGILRAGGKREHEDGGGAQDSERRSSRASRFAREALDQLATGDLVLGVTAEIL